MADKRPKLSCPKCGATMNQHAEKLVLAIDLREARRIDSALGGLVEEFHSCPNCGNSETREATESFMLDAIKRHWPEYLMEVAGLGLFMI